MCRSWFRDFIFPRYVPKLKIPWNQRYLRYRIALDIEKDDLPEAFIDRLEHVDERGLVGSIQLWTGARRNTETSFIYKG